MTEILPPNQATARADAPTVRSPALATPALAGGLPVARTERDAIAHNLAHLLQQLKQQEGLDRPIGMEPVDAAAFESRAYAHFLAQSNSPLYPNARKAPYEPEGATADGVPADLDHRETFTMVARGASHLKENEPGQDRALALSTPTLRIGAVSDGISLVRQSERGAAILVHMAVLAAEEVASEAIALNQSTATREFGAKLNARLARKVLEGINALGCDIPKGASLLGSATLNIVLVTPFEGSQWALGDGYAVDGPVTKKTSDITGRSRLDRTLVEVDPLSQRVTRPLGRAASSIWILMQQLSGEGEFGASPGPATRATARIFSSFKGQGQREQLLQQFPIDPSTPRGADPYLAAIFDVVDKEGDESETTDLQRRLAERIGAAGSLAEAKAGVMTDMINEVLAAESAEGLQLTRNCTTGEIDGDIEFAVSSDGQRYVDEEVGRFDQPIDTSAQNSYLRREWLTAQPPEVAAEVVELWNRLALDRWESPTLDAERRALRQAVDETLDLNDREASNGAIDFLIELLDQGPKQRSFADAIRHELDIPEEALLEAADEEGKDMSAELASYRNWRGAFMQRLAEATADQLSKAGDQTTPEARAILSRDSATQRLSDLGVRFTEGMPPLLPVWDDLGFAGVRAKSR